jgi:hypothetical protein
MGHIEFFRMKIADFRKTARKALHGGNIDIMVNDYTNQQIRPTMAQYIFKE